MDELIHKADVLHEALPYIQRFRGKIFVIKYGGHAMTEPALRTGFARDVTLLKYVGIHPIVVHGGGPQIDETLASLGAGTERIDGLRVTDDRTMDVVEMVLGGKIDEIVSLICGHGGRAVGLTGKDDRLVLAERVTQLRTKSGKLVDPGRVGKVSKIHPELLERLVAADFIPVVAPVAVDADGHALNVNADTVAGQIAAALPAEKLILMTDIAGVKGADGAIASSLSAREIEDLREAGVIEGGMLPKVECALAALAGGVRKVHVVDGRVRHATLLELFTDEGIGTQILKD